MSFHFYVDATRRPQFEEIFSRIDTTDLDVISGGEQPGLPSGSWPEGTVQLHYLRRSTRGVGVSLEDGAFDVCLNTLASPEDHQLAVAVAAALAETMDGDVAPEGGDRVSVAELRDQYDRRWIDDQVQSAATLLFHLLDDPQRQVAMPIAMPGPIRDFHFGPRLAARLRAGDPANLTDRLIDAARRVQYVHLEDALFPASIMRISDPDGKAVDASVFGPGVRYLFPAVAYFILTDLDQQMLFLPSAHLAELTADRLKWLDERHALVDSYSEPEYGKLIERARPLQAFPLGQPEQPKKKKGWWPFDS